MYNVLITNVFTQQTLESLENPSVIRTDACLCSQNLRAGLIVRDILQMYVLLLIIFNIQISLYKFL